VLGGGGRGYSNSSYHGVEISATSGLTNTGGGGGGGWFPSPYSGSGGSGIIIVRWAK
jgi:hypothetical protein